MPDIAPPPDDLFRLLVDRVRDYAIFALDPAGLVTSWNAGAEHIKGYRAEEIIGHHFSRFYPQDAVRSGWPQFELQEAKRLGRFEDEGWRVRKDGSLFWANVVITALFDSAGELRGFAKVTRDLSERKRLERLEADAQIMSEFVAMLAHELRNPLAPIRSAVMVGEHPSATDEKKAWAFGVINRQSAHLAALVDDLLDVSRITSGRIRLDYRRLHLTQPLEAALEATRTSCEERRHQVTYERTADPVVRGDIVRITQIVTNLLGNACKYTPPGGKITVLLSESNGMASVTVSDTGVGISPELLPRIFDLFTQEKRSLDRSDGGLGLGLAIAHNLAKKHGGTLTASSAGPGCGSEFVLSLPSLPEADADKVSVLVVDDNRDAASSMQAMLEMIGHRAHVAFDGEAGLELAKKVLPDVALLDIGLPGLNGYDLARKLRAIPELKGIKLLAVTGYSTDDAKQTALEAGFDLHFSKPADFPAIVAAVPLLKPVKA